MSNDLYYCPAAGEIESATHGGFDVCCSAPELHQPLTADEADILARMLRDDRDDQ